MNVVAGPEHLKCGVVIPVNNEPRLEHLLGRFDFGVVSRVVVVDDGSTDGCTAVCERYPVTYLRHPQRTGVGAAIRTGLLHLQAQGFDIAVVMAGNNKDDPAEVPALLAALHNGADYAQGTRYAIAANAKGTPSSRRIITRAVALLWSVRFLSHLTDVTNGFRAYRLSILDDRRVDVTQPWLDRYELEYYLHYKALSLGYRYVEVPVTKQYPKDGLPTTKIQLSRDYWSLLRPLILLTLGLRK